MRKIKSWLFGSTMVVLWVVILMVGSVSFGFVLNRITNQTTPARKEVLTHPTSAPTSLDPLAKTSLVQQVNQIIQGHFSTSGQQDVAVTYTNKQLEEMIATVKIPATEDVQVSWDDQGMVVLQFKLGKNTHDLLTLVPSLKDYQAFLSLAQGCQVKIKASINWDQQNKLALKLDTITLAGVAIPTALIQTADQSLNKNVINVLDKMEGLEVKKLEFHTDSITFEGRVPQSIILDQVSSVPQ